MSSLPIPKEGRWLIARRSSLYYFGDDRVLIIKLCGKVRGGCKGRETEVGVIGAKKMRSFRVCMSEFNASRNETLEDECGIARSKSQVSRRNPTFGQCQVWPQRRSSASPSVGRMQVLIIIAFLLELSPCYVFGTFPLSEF